MSDTDKTVISSRIRLARNFSGVPFVTKMTEDNRKGLIEEIHEKVKADNKFSLSYLDMANTSAIQAGSMMEEHLISPEFAKNRKGEGLLLSEDKSVSAMLCEEDHLRLQLLGKGNVISELWTKAAQTDDYFDSVKPYAFSDELGFLTACPTNLGTGMRASLMMHLPALTESGLISSFINAASGIGFTVRGMYGEGTRADGCIYQISNRISMGISEEDTLERLTRFGEKVCESEKNVSAKLLSDVALADRIGRAEGILRYAKLMTSAEFMKLYSDARWGACRGLNGLDAEKLDALFMKVQPYTLMLGGEENLGVTQRDRKRAEILRESI